VKSTRFDKNGNDGVHEQLMPAQNSNNGIFSVVERQ